MSKLITNTIRHTGGSADNITLDNSQNVTVEGNATVDGTSTLTGNVTCSGQLKTDAIRHTGASSDAITLASDGTATAKITNQPPGNRNLIINGAFNVAQRSASSTSGGYTTVDRFEHVISGTDEAPTFAQVDVTSNDPGPWEKGFRKAFRFTNGNQTGGAGVTDFIWLRTYLEAQNIAQSGWNYTSASSYITLSFWIKSSVAQDFKGYVRTFDGTDQMYPFATGSLSADTWAKITKTIPGNANVQFDNDNGAGLQVNILPFIGTDYTNNATTENAWAAFDSTARVQDMTSTWYTTNDAQLEITGVQLEVGDTATDFDHRSYSEDLFLCKRYYQTTAQTGTEAYKRHGIGFSASTSAMYTIHYLNPPMRAVPAESSSGNFRVDGHTTRDVTSLSYQHPTQECVQVVFNDSGGGMNSDTNWIARANNDTSERVNFEAEL